MTRVQFLNDLYHHLYGMTQEQAEQHLTYYAEMLADRIEEGMSEEDAVASMEDVETIARRIMEEEGLPYTPPDQRPPVPPSYPDASRLGGGGGSRAYQAPKRFPWKRAAQAALWTVAIIAVIGAVGRWGLRRQTPRAPEPGDAVESADPQEIWDYSETPAMEGFGYSEGGYYFDVNDVKGIEVEWAAGMVTVDSWSEDSICITEYAENELNDRTRMELDVNGEVLNVRYRQSGGLLNVKGQKWLSILLPDGMMGEINISTASADVQVYNVELDTLRTETASGGVTTDQCFTQTAQIQTISGDVGCSELHANQADITTTSGDIWGNVYGTNVKASSTSGDIQLTGLNMTEQLDLNTVSGDIFADMTASAGQKIDLSTISGSVSLALPYDLGFTLDYATISGEINVSGNFDGNIFTKSGTHTFGGGECGIHVETTSGNVEIY